MQGVAHGRHASSMEERKKDSRRKEGGVELLINNTLVFHLTKQICQLLGEMALIPVKNVGSTSGTGMGGPEGPRLQDDSPSHPSLSPVPLSGSSCIPRCFSRNPPLSGMNKANHIIARASIC